MKETLQKKVVKLNQAPFASSVVEKILKKLKEGALTELVLIARSKVPKEEQEDGIRFILDHYWFSEGASIPVLGLLEYMKNKVYEFIERSSDEYED